MSFREKVLQSNQVLYTFHPTPHSHALQSVCPRFNSSSSIRTFFIRVSFPNARGTADIMSQNTASSTSLYSTSMFLNFLHSKVFLVKVKFFLKISWLRSNTYQLEEFLLDSKEKKKRNRNQLLNHIIRWPTAEEKRQACRLCGTFTKVYLSTKSPFLVPVDGSKIHFYFHLSTLFVLPSLSMTINLRFLFITVCPPRTLLLKHIWIITDGACRQG